MAPEAHSNEISKSSTTSSGAGRKSTNKKKGDISAKKVKKTKPSPTGSSEK